MFCLKFLNFNEQLNSVYIAKIRKCKGGTGTYQTRREYSARTLLITKEEERTLPSLKKLVVYYRPETNQEALTNEQLFNKEIPLPNTKAIF